MLIVDDLAINQLALVKLLEHLGHAVSLANDGFQALELLDQEQFDIVLMDVQMPGMDGVVLKPIDILDLKREMIRAIDR